MKVSFK